MMQQAGSERSCLCSRADSCAEARLRMMSGVCTTGVHFVPGRRHDPVHAVQERHQRRHRAEAELRPATVLGRVYTHADLRGGRGAAARQAHQEHRAVVLRGRSPGGGRAAQGRSGAAQELREGREPQNAMTEQAWIGEGGGGNGLVFCVSSR